MSALNKYQQELLKKAAPTADQILEHMDDFNEEIAETWSGYIEAPPKELEKPKVTRKLDLAVAELKEGKMPVEKVEEMVEADVDAQLEAELAALQKKVAARAEVAAQAAAEEEEKEELTPEERQHQAVMSLLRNMKGAPSDATIEKLKSQNGKIHVLALGENDIYLFTYLRRGQWKKIQQLVQAAASSDVNVDAEETLKEKVVQYCVKWPKGVSSPEFLYNAHAGVMDTLYQSILLHSYFLSPQQAMMLTTQL